MSLMLVAETKCLSIAFNSSIVEHNFLFGWMVSLIPSKYLISLCFKFRTSTKCKTFIGGAFIIGTHPRVEDGIVDRSACMTHTYTFCDVVLPIKIVNCGLNADGIERFAYYLTQPTTSHAAYCIGDIKNNLINVYVYKVWCLERLYW